MRDIDEIRRCNLRRLEEELGGPTVAAGRLGMSLAQFANLRDGAKDSKTGKPRGMRKETARRIELAGEKPVGWLDRDHSTSADADSAEPPAPQRNTTYALVSGPVSIPFSKRDALPAGYVRLEHLSPRPSMGPGASLAEPVHVVQHLDVLESWVRQKVGSADYDRVKILTGCGQSMLPTIHDQDLVFVDISQRTIDVPGIYVVDVYGRFLLKRALILSDGTLVLKSDNVDEFPDEERIDLLKAADTITVAGRVKAWWTLRQG